MRTLKIWTLTLACLAAGAGCNANEAEPSEADTGPAGALEARAAPLPDGAAAGCDGSYNKAARCASTFGSGLTNGFGRLDGKVLAVVGPTDKQCPQWNNDHLVLQVTVNGAVYRMVVNVLSDGRNGTDTRMKYLELPHAALGEPWSEGWHLGVSLDYPNDLGTHMSAFVPHAMVELVGLVSSRLEVGSRISVYATTRDKPSSAHLIHRNQNTAAADDGAIVIGPDTAEPIFLLFAFDGTTF